MTHDELRDQLPAFALGALDAGDEREVAAHVATCAACAAEVAALDRVVDGIGLEAPPVTPPATLRSRVLARVAAEQTAAGRGPARIPIAKRPIWSSGLALAASVTLAIGASIYAFTLRSELTSLRQDVANSASEASRLRGELTTLRRTFIDVTRTMNILKAPDMLKVDLKGQATAGAASGRAFWSRTAGLIFTADGLPALPPGFVYQLWTIVGTVATGAGTFTADSAGAASIASAVTPDAPRPDAFGVTIEPAGGSQTPTMPIVLVGGTK